MTALQRFCRVLLLVVLLAFLPATLLAGAVHWALGGLVFVAGAGAMAWLVKRVLAPATPRAAAAPPPELPDSAERADPSAAPWPIPVAAAAPATVELEPFPSPSAAAAPATFDLEPFPSGSAGAGAGAAAAPLVAASPAPLPAEAQPAPVSRWQRMPLRARREWIAAAAVVAVIVGLRLYRLDDLQGEWYGDISTLYEYADSVRHLDFPADYYNLGVGPAYPFILWPLLAVMGVSYLSMKISAVLISLAGLGVLFLWCRRLVGTPFALIATAVAGTGSWLLIFSRLGDVEAAVLLFTIAPLALAARILESPSRRSWSAALCGLIAAGCAYLYGAAFMVPVVVTALLLIGCLTSLRGWWLPPPRSHVFGAEDGAHRSAKRSDLWIYLVTVAVVLAPFAVSYARTPKAFAEGHFATRIVRGPGAVIDVAANFGKALLAYVTRGDDGFRGNPPDLPHIDPLTLALALVGCVFWLQPARRKWGAVILGGFLLMHLPSTLVTSFQAPSAPRTISAAPFAYILAAGGIWWLAQRVERRFGSTPARGLVVALLATVTVINAHRYFVRYIAGLPYQNTHVARAITTFVDLLPADTKVYLVEAPWTPGGMPEPKSIRYQMKHPDNLFEETVASMNCSMLRAIQRPAVLIWSFGDRLPSSRLEDCSDPIEPRLFRNDRDVPLFQAAMLRASGGPARAAPPPPPEPEERPAGASDFEHAEVEVNGQMAELLYQPIDMGQPVRAFDDDPDSVMRGELDNPYRLELRFQQPIEVSTVVLDLGYMPIFEVEITLIGPDGDETTLSRHEEPPGGSVHLELAVPDGPVPVTAARLTIEDIRDKPGEGWHIHIYGLHFE